MVPVQPVGGQREGRIIDAGKQIEAVRLAAGVGPVLPEPRSVPSHIGGVLAELVDQFDDVALRMRQRPFTSQAS